MNEITIKKSIRRSTWQAKGNNHEIDHLGWLESVLKPCLSSLQIDPEDDRILVLFTFDDKEFDGHQFGIREAEEPEELRDAKTYGKYYELVDNPVLGHVGGHVPPFLLKFFGAVPQKIYMRFEVTHRSAFVT